MDDVIKRLFLNPFQPQSPSVVGVYILHLSNTKTLVALGYIGDYATRLREDYNEPL